MILSRWMLLALLSCTMSVAVAQRQPHRYVPPKQPAADENCFTKDARWVNCNSLPETDASRASRAVHQAHEREEADKKKRCGKDYMALRIGMHFDRVEQCFEALSYVTDTVSGGGTVETYRSTFYLLHFSNGVMVGYTRRVR